MPEKEVSEHQTVMTVISIYYFPMMIIGTIATQFCGGDSDKACTALYYSCLLYAIYCGYLCFECLASCCCSIDEPVCPIIILIGWFIPFVTGPAAFSFYESCGAGLFPWIYVTISMFASFIVMVWAF